MDDFPGEIARATDRIRRDITFDPEFALVLGTGYGAFTSRIESPQTLSYRDIPGFPESTVPGHAGTLVAGSIRGVPVAVMSGRAHLYEGNTPRQTAFPVFALAALGVKNILLTNASGGVAQDLLVGDVIVIRDHLFFPGFAGASPLTGLPAELGSGFLPLDGLYDAGLSSAISAGLDSAGLRSREGVYAMVAGPHYETPAEIRFLRNAGADVVGMSTVIEAIAARHQGMRVAAISLVTNSHAVSSDVSHEEVQAAVAASSAQIGDAIVHLIDRTSRERAH